MILRDILSNIDLVEVHGSIDIDISDVVYDSRRVKKGSLFVCIEGTAQDGHRFIPDAIRNGASAVLASRNADVPGGVTLVLSPDTRRNLAAVSDAFFAHPTGKIKLIGITGTKGKTTITYMIKSILETAGYKVGLIGTIGSMIGSEILHTQRTTPESYDLQSMFSLMVQEGMDFAVMEVSSQGLALHRVDFCEFDTAVFTNLSRDHIAPREHASMEEYFLAKLKLFGMARKALVNSDSEYGLRIIDAAKIPVYKYGLGDNADVKASDIHRYPASVSFRAATPWWEGDMHVGIPGTFSVYNALAASGIAGLYGIGHDTVANGLSGVRVGGRAEAVETAGLDMTVIVDYAHTPDSLENILSTLKENAKGRLVCVFGCGGDRDKAKRPLMGEISGRLCDLTLITSDNPRSEDPDDITEQIEQGVKTAKGAYEIIVDRKEAIRCALTDAQPSDTIVIAGKGHEDYQQFKDRTIHFDDREVAKEIIDEIHKRA